MEGFVRRDGYVTSAELALTYGELGKKDAAFGWLEKAFEAHTRDLIYLNVDPGFDALRADPRFQDYLGRMNFPQQSVPD